MNPHTYQPPGGSQHSLGASAGSGYPPSYMSADIQGKPPTIGEAFKELRQIRYIPWGSGLSQQSRDGHNEATHINNNVEGSASKHGTLPSGCSGIFDMFGTHLEHKHPPPVFTSAVQVTQDHNAVCQVPSYIHEAAKGDNSNQCSELSYSSESQNYLLIHTSDGTYSERIPLVQCRTSGIHNIFPRRQPEPSAKGFVEQKPNVSKIADGKADVSYFMDCSNYSVLFVDNEPIPPCTESYEHYITALSDEKENIAGVHSLFGENRHESSTNRRPVISDIKDKAVHSCQTIKLKSKPYINTVKEDDSMDICSEVCDTSAPRQHPTPLVLEQLPLQPNDRQNCQPVLPHINETLPSLHQQHSQFAALDQAKFPVSAASHVPVSVCESSETLHHGRTTTTSPLSNKSILSQSNTAVPKMIPLVEARSMPELPSSPPPSGSPLHGNTTKLQGLFSATRCHQMSSSSSQPECLPVEKKLNEMRGYGNITIPEEDKCIWKSVLDPMTGTGLKMKFVRERVKGGIDSTGSSSKSKDKDLHKGKKAPSLAPSNIIVPEDNFICMSASKPLAGIGQKNEIQIDRPKGHSDSAGKGAQSVSVKGLKIKNSNDIPSTSRKLSQLVPPPGLPPRTPVLTQPSDKKPSTCSFQTHFELARRAPLLPIPVRKACGGLRHCKEDKSTARKLSKQKLKSHLPFGCYYKAGPVHEPEYTSIPVLLPLPGKVLKTQKYVLKRGSVFGRLSQPIPCQ